MGLRAGVLICASHGIRVGSSSMSRANIFISYSHRDRHWQEWLVTHLGVLEREGRIELWHDQRLVPGEDFARRLDEQMRTARIAVLLLSADFLTSEFVREKEVPTLLQRHAAAGMLIYPLLIRDCAWQEVPWLANLQLRPPDARPLASQSGRRDQVLADVARE